MGAEEQLVQSALNSRVPTAEDIVVTKRLAQQLSARFTSETERRRTWRMLYNAYLNVHMARLFDDPIMVDTAVREFREAIRHCVNDPVSKAPTSAVAR